MAITVDADPVRGLCSGCQSAHSGRPGCPGIMPAMTSPRARLAAVPLRVRLVAAVLVLVALGLLVSGLVAAGSMRSYLVTQEDEQLKTAIRSPGLGLNGPGGRGGQRQNASLNRFYVQVITDGGVRVELSTTPAQPPELPSAEETPVGRPFTVPASEGDDRWRVLAAATRDGDVVVLASDLGDVDRTVDRLVATEAVVGAVVLALLAGAAYGLVRTSLRPLVEVERTAAAIAGGDLSQRVPRTDDRTEVGRLGAAFNAMVGRIEGSFRAQQESEAAARESEARMRRFVGDASHELRTPLTSIRGFAELYRQGAVPAGPDLDRVMGRVEGEAARMGQLVDEMLLLARLDQHRELVRAPVDLLALAVDAVHDARALDPGRPVELAAPPQPPVVLGDEARLRQVLVNLLGNALTHTPPGTPVTVRLRPGPAAGTVLLEVADRGPGLTPEQASHVFERFYRGDTARTRTSGGTGLGLSIVAALAEAHGGRVGVTATPGGGATFLVELPLTPDTPERQRGVKPVTAA